MTDINMIDINKVLWAYTRRRQQEDPGGWGRVIEVGGEPYLTRVFLDAGGEDSGVFLHYFHKGDQGRDFHNHPWEYARSVILWGGYFEERCVRHRFGAGSVMRRTYSVGAVVELDRDTFHRVDLHGREGVGFTGCWTLFMRGKRCQSWGFLNRETGEYTDAGSDDSTND